MVNPRRKSRGEAKFGTGGVTDVQIAFLVECYLKDNSYGKTLDEFRVEASPMLSPYKSEAPMSMMSLSAILNDYILLKEQTLVVQRQKARLDHMFGCLKDMVASYQSTSLTAPEAPALIAAPPSTVPVTGSSQRENATKRKSPTPAPTSTGQQENSMVDVTTNGMRTKRVRHVPPASTEQPVLQGLNPNTSPEMQKQPITPSSLKPCTSVALGHFGPFSPPLNGPLDPQTPQTSKLQTGCSFQVPQTNSKTPSLVCSTTELRDARRARSKRQPLNPTKAQSSKCKSLDFTSTSDPVIVKQTTTLPSEKPPPALESSPPLPADIEEILTEGFATPGQLSSIDDILGTSLDGTSFSELMNSMIVDDISDEAISPCNSAGLSPATVSDRNITEVLSLEDDGDNSFQVADVAAGKMMKKAAGKENTPPPSFLI